MRKLLLTLLFCTAASGAMAQGGGDTSISSLGNPFNSQSPNNFWLEEERRREARSRGQIYRPGREPTTRPAPDALYGAARRRRGAR